MFVESRRVGLQTFLQSLCTMYPHSEALLTFLTSDAKSMIADETFDGSS